MDTDLRDIASYKKYSDSQPIINKLEVFGNLYPDL